MIVYIIGANGNMATRYKRILEATGHSWIGSDIADSRGFYDLTSPIEKSDAVLIATPTATHATILRTIRDCDKPILCEKPLTTDLSDLERLLAELDAANTSLQMVSQYDYLIDDVGDGPTYYNYFKTGQDGLAWDCINIAKHARGEVTLKNDSPVWKCWINGQKLNFGLMDLAYIEMLQDWLATSDETDLNSIWTAHKKAHDLEAKCRAS